MTTTLEAAENLQRFLRPIKALLDINPALFEVGGIEQAANEARGTLEAARRETCKARDELLQIMAEIETAKEHRDSILADAKRQADEIKSAAKIKAESREAAALKSVEAIADAARRKNIELQQSINVLIADTRELEERRDAAAASLAGINAEIDAVRRKLST